MENSTDIQHSISCMTTPRLERQILGDGNCFFRAVSFSLTNSEDFHNVMRNAVCQHMLEYKELFQQFLNNEQSVESHISSCKMNQEGKWATEVEIFATAHLLNTDIYTFSGGSWMRFSVDDVEPYELNRTGAIYLNHHQQNHYNVVLSVNGENLDMTQIRSQKTPHQYKKRYQNRIRMQEKRLRPPEKQENDNNAERRKRSLRKRYKDDVQFREKKLKLAFDRYLGDEEFKANVRNHSLQKYHSDIAYNTKTNERSRREVKRKYATDQEHKNACKKRSIEKYATDIEHRQNLKKRSIDKYATDDDHRENMKKRSIDKF